MAIELIQNTAGQEVPFGPFLSDTDGKTPLDGLTIANTDIKLWKSGATSLVNKNSGGATLMANGVYYATFDATDTATQGSFVIFIHKSGALPVRVECEVKPLRRYLEDNYWRHVVFFQATGSPTTTTIPIGAVSYSDIPAHTSDGSYVGMQLLSLFDYSELRRVSGYVGSTKTLTVDPPLPFMPTTSHVFMLLPGAPGVLADGAITAAKVADNFLTAAKVAADVTTELQTGLATAAALATVSGLVDDLEGRLSATRAGYLDNLSGGAVATAAALATVNAYVDELESRLTAARAGYLDSLNSGVPLSAATVDAIIDEVVEGSTTLRQAMRLLLATLVGKASGGGTASVTFRDLADTKNRVVMTTDANGNRTAVTRDAT